MRQKKKLKLKTKTTNKLSLFDHLANITENKIEFDPKDNAMASSYSPFMINRFVSMCEFYIPICNEINKFPDLSKSDHHRFYRVTLPKRKQYFGYIKKKKNIQEDDILKVAEYFECGNREAEKYIQMLSPDQLQEILNIYKTGVSRKKI